MVSKRIDALDVSEGLGWWVKAPYGFERRLQNIEKHIVATQRELGLSLGSRSLPAFPRGAATSDRSEERPVSYTHLTLPTILLV